MNTENETILTNNKQTNPSLFSSKIFSAWFILSIIAMVFLAMSNQIGLATLVFGQLFLVSGIATLLKASQKKPENIVRSFLFSIIGAVIMGIGYIIAFGTEEMITSLKNATPIFFYGIFLLVGIYIAITGILSEIYQKAHCTVEVNAEVVNILSHRSSYHAHHDRRHHHTVYAPVWRYYYQGTYYERAASVYSYPCRYHIGQQKNIKINPDNPEEITSDILDNLLSIIIGSIFAVVGGVCIFVELLH